MSAVSALMLACLLLSTAAWSAEAAPPPAAAKAAAAALKRNSARCLAHAGLDACSDAVRWNPSDPALLVALADALARAQRPADAIRNYRRAAALAPNMRGIAAKISAAEAKLSSRRALVDRASFNGVPGKRYSNDAPETQSH